VTIFGDGAIGSRNSPDWFLLEVTQLKRELSGLLIFENPLTGDFVESADISSVSLSGPNQATISGDCFNVLEGPCTFTVTVHGNQPVESFAITGTGFTPEAGPLIFGAIEIFSGP
jgi:hypothetical protein